MSNLIHASKEKPVMLCKTCGVATSYVQKLHHNQPIKREKRKTWRRIDKVNKDGKDRIVYFSSIFLERGCLEKKHKLGVRFAPFPRFLITELNFKRKGIVE